MYLETESGESQSDCQKQLFCVKHYVLEDITEKSMYYEKPALITKNPGRC